MRIIWRDPVWCLDLLNSDKRRWRWLPLITGADLLAQYAYLNLGFKLVVVCDIAGQENPTKLIWVSPVTSTLLRSNHVTELDASFRTVAA
jgi:hypothetical protein